MPSGSALFLNQGLAIETSFQIEMINPRDFEKFSLSFLPSRGGKMNRQSLLVLTNTVIFFLIKKKKTNTVINHQKKRRISYQITYYRHSLHIYPCSFLFLYFVLNDHYLDHLVGSH